jgi:hypothetical protein
MMKVLGTHVQVVSLSAPLPSPGALGFTLGSNGWDLLFLIGIGFWIPVLLLLLTFFFLGGIGV